MLVVPLCVLVMASRAVAVLVASSEASAGVQSWASDLIATKHPKCHGRFTLACLKLDVARLISHYALINASYQLVPGFYIQHKSMNISMDKSANPDAALAHSVNTYLETVGIYVHLNQSSILPKFSSFGEAIITGRSKKAALYSAGTVAAVAFAMLAAMSGKALMASLLALMLSAMGALRGHGGGSGAGKTSHYEIITKPAAITAPAGHIYDHEQLLHSSAGSYAAGPSSYSTYSYGRMNNAERHQEDSKESGVVQEMHAAPYRTVGLKEPQS